FADGAGPGRPAEVGRDPGRPFYVEVSLYAPGSQPCRDDQPLVGLGRSPVVDLAHDSGPVEVPLGCRNACEQHQDGSVRLLALADLQTVVPTPADLQLGELVPYPAFVSTAGQCTSPPSNAKRGVFRPFAVSHDGDTLSGTWVVASSIA